MIIYRYTVAHCPRCKWPFHCPNEQIEKRIYCRACESFEYPYRCGEPLKTLEPEPA